MKNLLKVDPRSWIMGWCVWCVLQGVQLAGPGHILERGFSFTMMHKWIPNGIAWGGIMIADAAALLLCFFATSSRAAGAIVVSSAAFWTLCGVSMVASGAQSGFVSAAGCWCICGASILILSAAQLGRRI